MNAIAIALAFVMLGSSGAAGAQVSAKQHAGPAHTHNVQTPFGIAGETRDATRTIEIRMIDEMRFVPGTIDVHQGETIRLRLVNTGKLPHELVVGTKKDLEQHAAMMMDGIEHDEPHAAHVPPGRTGEIVWNFNRAGRFDYACLVAGHYQAGMAGKINVVRR